MTESYICSNSTCLVNENYTNHMLAKPNMRTNMQVKVNLKPKQANHQQQLKLGPKLIKQVNMHLQGKCTQQVKMKHLQGKCTQQVKMKHKNDMRTNMQTILLGKRIPHMNNMHTH